MAVVEDLLVVDGDLGEGGGQVLRSALALSLALGRPFRIRNIRANRAKPGLRRQHLTCVLAAQAICGAEVDGAELGARELTFSPGGPIRAEGGEVGYDYTLRPILFVVPRGDTARQESRRKDAEALRSRFTTCDSGLLFARSLRDVAIREPIIKNSSDLVPALRQILDKTEVGHLTPPETTTQGVELFALCEKKETKSETPEKRQAREKIFSEQFDAKAKNYLRELRRQAMIERK